MIIKLEPQIMGAVKVIGHNAPFLTLRGNTNILDTEHCYFFKRLINYMYTLR